METVRIQDPEWKKVGSGIWDKHSGSATLVFWSWKIASERNGWVLNVSGWFLTVVGIVSERFLTVWDEFSWLVADSTDDYYAVDLGGPKTGGSGFGFGFATLFVCFFVLFLLHDGMIRIREVQKHTGPDQHH
jgi:hypothetical protein